jgi:hypothetical protein
MNNQEVIAQLERKTKEMTRASIRISRFLNMFVLRCLKNNIEISKLNKRFIQYFCTALFGMCKNPKRTKRDMLNKIANMDGVYKVPEYQFTHLDNLISYICGNLEANIQKIFIFISEERPISRRRTELLALLLS